MIINKQIIRMKFSNSGFGDFRIHLLKNDVEFQKILVSAGSEEHHIWNYPFKSQFFKRINKRYSIKIFQYEPKYTWHEIQYE